MKTKSMIILLISFVIVTQTGNLLAQVKADKSMDSWTLLGTKTVDYTIDRDVVSLKDSKENFTSLKFIVKNGTLNMHKCTVHFDNGNTEVIEFSKEVNKNNDGRTVELKGSNRKIEKVTFWYDTKNNSENRTIVELWGQG